MEDRFEVNEEWCREDWERFWRQLLQLSWWTYCTAGDPDEEMLSLLHRRWTPLSTNMFPRLGPRTADDHDRQRPSDLERWTKQMAPLKCCADLPSFRTALHKVAYHFTFAWTHRAFDEFIDSYVTNLSPLEPEVIGSLREVSIEFMAWLSKHMNSLPAVHWEAFEHIVREVLASHGFQVVHVARQRGRSADLIAFDRAGTSYLVECKRYANDRTVGIDIVNAVLGAALRNGVERSMLVTSTGFSPDVAARASEWAELNIELYDGRVLADWLRAYRPTQGMGLWVDEESQSEFRKWLIE